MRTFRKDEGFTLVELMVVVLIIGILVAVAIPVFNAASGSARERACVANLRTLDGSVEQWKAANPNNNPTWTTVSGSAATAAQSAIGSYVKDWVKTTTCPSGGTISVAFTTGAAGQTNSAQFSCSTTGHSYLTPAP